MAVAKDSIRRTRRSASPKSRRRTQPAPLTAKTSTPSARHRLADSTYFDAVRGKTLDDVSVTMNAQGSLITLTFNDKTEMTLDIEPRISVGAMLESWKSGNSRILRRWPRIRTA